MRTVCFVTGTRAEFGLLHPLIVELKKSKKWKVQGIVTGTHLSPEFGKTRQEIPSDLFYEEQEIEIILSSDSAVGISKSMGLGLISFGETYARFNPDLIIVLGDRYEILAAVAAALVHKIPVAHLHGGERTEGAFDENIRHAITKMSHLHFTSTEEYRRRVIQMGENPDAVFNVGAIGLDNVMAMPLLDQAELGREMGISFEKKIILLTYHPATLEDSDPQLQVNALLTVLGEYDDVFVVCTKANSDTNGRLINSMLERYSLENPHQAVLFDSLGALKYLSIMKQAALVLGNSSSGIIEAPGFGVPVVNIGERQKGRVSSDCVIHCGYSEEEIRKAVNAALDPSFREKARHCSNPYGEGRTALQIAAIMGKFPDFHSLLKKRFHDLEQEM